MVCGGSGEDTKTTDLRHTIHVLVHADIVLWFLGLALLLPMTWGWYSGIHIQLFMAFPIYR